MDDRPTRDLWIGALGHIRSGTEVGRVVEVIDDLSNSGGFLICTYANADRTPEAFDSWMESIVELDLYFEEAGWNVEWIDPSETT